MPDIGDPPLTKEASIKEHLHLIPVPRAFVVSGQLDQIGHGIFETMPEAETGEGEAADALSEPERLVPISRASGKAMRHVDPMILWGAWPGDEPIEELLAELD